MQPYYAIKLKCFVLRMMMGCSLLLISAGIVISILQEVMNSYDANSRLAYILGLLICALMVALGILLIYQAFHFERFVFGRAGNGGVSASLWMDCVQSSRSSFQLNDYVFWGGKLRESDRKAERSFKDMERSEYK